jgi:hypothetical protein
MGTCNKCDKEHDGTFGSGKYCSVSCANSRTFSEGTKKIKSLSNHGKIPWNKGTKIKWVKSICLGCGNEIDHIKSRPKKYHPECWLKLSGGVRKGAGVGKSGWYKGYWCDSSYELAWVIYQLEHDIPFERNTQKYSYFWNGIEKNYIPDFIQNGKIIEIKGYVNDQIKVKLNIIKDLNILFREDLKKEFEYVESKYGKNFISLYENNFM